MPTRAFVVSALGHIGFLAACLLWSAWWVASQPKTYIVNLVPSVAAVGSPAGRASTRPSREEPAPRVARFTPRTEAARPATPKAEPARSEVARAAPADTTAVPAPPARVTPRATVARDAPILPGRTIPRSAPSSPRATAPPRTPSLPSQPPPRRFEGDEPAPRARPVERVPATRVARPTREDAPARTPLRDARPAPALRAPTMPVPSPVADVARRTLPDPAPNAPRAPDSVARPIRPESLPRLSAKELPSVASAVKTALAPTSPPPSPVPAPVPAPTAPPAAPARTAAPVPPPAPPALGQPTGSVHGKGAITLQASDFPFTLYLQTVQRKIHERWTPPPREAGGRAVIVFEINRDGSVRRPTVENSSGDAHYDHAALRAVIDANPFPPLPEGFRESILKIHLGFDFAPYRG